ncbi:MAG: adenylosuccinate lyase [SAR324 cluster bacterium]|nr:adenylosuccinate lyase [SAR324 cluster bacterium]
MTNQLTALSPLDGRYHSKVSELNHHFSEFGLIRRRLQVEVEWLIALGNLPETSLKAFTKKQQTDLRKLYEKMTPKQALEVKETEKVTNHDVKAVEYYLGARLEEMKMGDLKPWVHFACTSEDINNLSHALILKGGLDDVVIPKMNDLIETIEKMATAYKAIPMMSKTHGQPATPSTMGKEFQNVAERLKRQFNNIISLEFLGKINGAVGNFNAHRVAFPDVDWKPFARDFVESLDLDYNPFTTQIEPHDYMAELFDSVRRFNTIVLDFDRDIWGYISNNAFKQIPVAGQTGSSTMPHKINPIDFENSEGNLGIANALFDHLSNKLPVSRWQRDLTDSTVLRNMGVGFGYSLIAYKATLAGLGKLEINADVLSAELDQNWALLGEAMQTVMRKYGVENSYEKLKDLTRGKSVDAKSLAKFIDGLTELPDDVRRNLKKLTPATYLGYAKDY